MYSLSKLQNLTVKEVKNRCKHLEDPIWTRQLREWELEEVLEIFSIVKQTTKGKKKDVIRWSARHQVYSSRQGYNIIMGLDNSCINHWKKVWSFKVPPKISIFLWKYFHDILPLKKLLNERITCGIEVVCSLCGVGEESKDHLF